MQPIRKVISRIKRIFCFFVPEPLLLQWQIMRFDKRKIIYKGMSFMQYKEEAFKDFLPTASKEQKSSIERDMLHSYLVYHVRPDEYMLFGFESLNDEQRNSYLSQRAKDILVSRYYGKSACDVISFLRNKSAFYVQMKDYFKREALLVSSMDDLTAFTCFCQRHQRFIAKENTGGCGVGVQIIEDKVGFDYYKELAKLVSKGTWILEELIQQHPALSEFNPSSVNTVRFPSFRHGDNVVPAYPLLRFGRSGSIVDNASQGGVFVSIDINTGAIITDAFDEHGHRYDCHPDSGKRFKGYIIPLWNDLLALAKETHLSLPSNQVYVAFDFALTPNGWVLVEGNWGDMIMMEISLEKGLKNDFESLLYGK